jgi:hypothetical protein
LHLCERNDPSARNVGPLEAFGDPGGIYSLELVQSGKEVSGSEAISLESMKYERKMGVAREDK